MWRAPTERREDWFNGREKGLQYLRGEEKTRETMYILVFLAPQGPTISFDHVTCGGSWNSEELDQ